VVHTELLAVQRGRDCVPLGLSSQARRWGRSASRTARWSLHPHRLVSYKYVALVLASAQRLGVNKIGLIGNEAFLD